MNEERARPARQLAVVTGASSGIGRAFAQKLAARRHDLVIVARRGDVLEELAEELRAAHGAAVEVLVADLAKRNGVRALEKRVRAATNLALMVNNAGFGSSGPFAELDVDSEEEMLRLNTIAVMRLTHAALGPLLARGAGGIINVSSIGCFQPGPLNATYSASKAFVTSFTEAIHEEVRGSGVVVQALCPGFTRTGFQARARIRPARIPSLAWMDADTVVTASLRALRRGDAMCVPGIGYKLLAASTHTVPRPVVRRISGYASRRAVPRHE